MSDTLRIALVAEGPTDEIVITAALKALLPEETTFILRQIQPDTPGEDELGGSSDATKASTGCGWSGVYRWCRNVSHMGSGDILTVARMNYDFVIIHLDIDVSRESYTNAKIYSPEGECLPCNRPCPPASDSALALQKVVQSWLNPVATSKVVWCFPADNTETWGYAAWKSDKAQEIKNLECHHGIPSRLGSSIKKSVHSYRRNQDQLKSNWGIVEDLCPQALIFSNAVRAMLSHLKEQS